MRQPKVVGVISDTHGLLRPEALDALHGSDLIVHAGDIGDASILATLEQIAPVTAVRGNIDSEPWAQRMPATAVIEVGAVRLYVVHNVKELGVHPAALGLAGVISGHSHQPKQEIVDGVLYFNAGSAGPRRFKLPVSVGRLHVRDKNVTAEVVIIG
jgi:putative phosphoesterase